jgi:integrase
MGGLIDRYIEQILHPCLDVPLGGVQDSAAPMSFQCAKSYQSALNRWVRPHWQDYRLQDFNKPAVRASIEEWLRSLWRSPKNPKGLAPKMVRSIWNVMKLAFKFAVKWGYLNENPMGEKRVELPRGSTKRQKQPVQLTAAGFFLLLSRLGPCEKVAVAFAGWLGPRISEAFGLKWQDLDLVLGVVTFRQGCVQGRITPLKTEASRTNLPVPEEVLELLRLWRSVTLHGALGDWVFASPYTKGKRPFWPAQLMKKHIKPVALELGLPQHRLAQLPTHGERLGQGGGPRTGGGQESSAAREPRYHIRGLRRSWDGRQAADSAAASELRQTAGHTHTIGACTYLVSLCDPYLTQMLLADLLQVQEKNGSSGRTRTYNPPVNSRMVNHRLPQSFTGESIIRSPQGPSGLLTSGLLIRRIFHEVLCSRRRETLSHTGLMNLTGSA